MSESKKRSFTLSFKLEAIAYAENTNNSVAARYFKVDPKRVREWRKLKEDLEREGIGPVGKKKKNLSGQGNKLVSFELETEIFEWLLYKRSRGERVSCRMIRNEANKIFPTLDDRQKDQFVASQGWVHRFLKRNGLSIRRRTTTSQRDPDDLCQKIASFVLYSSHVRKKFEIDDSHNLAMDETSVWFDCIENTTVDVTGSRTINIKTTGHEKAHATVVLCARADGSKLPPFVVFKGQIRKVKAMTKNSDSNVCVATSVNGWMNNELTKDWLNRVFGKISASKRMLTWDSYKCHINQEIKDYIKSFNTEVLVIPGGCTKYIQAPDVSWNKPFKAKMNTYYDEWLADEINMEYTRGGNLRAVSVEILAEWVVKAWDSISPDVIKTSFKCCALTTAVDGTEDDQISCLKLNRPCRGAWDILINYRDSELNNSIFQIYEEDEEELERNEIIVDDDEEQDLNVLTVQNVA